MAMRFVGIAVMAIVSFHVTAQAPDAAPPKDKDVVLDDVTAGKGKDAKAQDAQALPLPDCIAQALASGDKKALQAAIVRLRKGTPEDRAVLRRLFDQLGPLAAKVAEPGRGAAPDPKAQAEDLSAKLRAPVAALMGSDAKASEAAVAELTVAADKGDAGVRTLTTRADAMAAACVLDAFAAAQQSRAIFAGQFAALKDYGPAVEKLLLAWLEKSPTGVPAEAVKTQCVRALRDIVTAPTEPVKAQLEKVAKDAKESRAVQKEAGYALAQFGNRTFVDPQIQ